VRFFCEWCHQQVSVVNDRSPYPEVLSHFSNCERRSPVTTDEQVQGLATHIAALISASEAEKRMREAG
jgi:hypothetical protein